MKHLLKHATTESTGQMKSSSSYTIVRSKKGGARVQLCCNAYVDQHHLGHPPVFDTVFSDHKVVNNGIQSYSLIQNITSLLDRVAVLASRHCCIGTLRCKSVVPPACAR